MLWARKDFSCGASLDDPAVSHLDDFLAVARSNTQIVRDEVHAEFEFLAQIVEQLEHLLLHRHIEG